MQKEKDSLLEQLAEGDHEQKREQNTAQELINEAFKKMAPAVEMQNMQSVKVAQLMLKAGNEKLQATSQKLQIVGAKQKDLRIRLHGPDKKIYLLPN